MLPPLSLQQFPPHRDCTACPLHKCAKSVGIPTHLIPGSLPPSHETPAVLFLGQNPGFNEDREGVPFIGKSGTILQDAYIDGVQLRSLATLYVSNTARCYHLHGDGPSNSHYKACRPHLLPDLHTLLSLHSSLTVMCLGAPATTHLHALLGIPKVTLTSSFSNQGRQVPLPPLSSETSQSLGPLGLPQTPDGRGASTITIFSSYHPAAVLRENNLIHAVQGHMTLLLNHLTGQTPAPSLPTLISPRSPP